MKVKIEITNKNEYQELVEELKVLIDKIKNFEFEYEVKK